MDNHNQNPFNADNNNSWQFSQNNPNPNNNPDIYGQNTNNGFYQQNNVPNMPNNQYNPFYQQPNNINQPYNRQYADPPKKKTPAKMYILLIAVIVFFAVIIVAMSTIMKAMVEKNNKHDDMRGNITLSKNDDEDSDDEDTENETEESYEEVPETSPDDEEMPVTSPAEEEEPEVVTVTVIVEVPAEPEPEHYDPPAAAQNYTQVYDTGFYGYITTQKDPLNMRSEPSKNAKVLTEIPKDTYIYVNDTSEYGWYYTTYNGQSGYVSADYVTAGSPPVYESYIPSTAVIATEQDALNLRQSASTNGTVITGIPKGSTVTIVEFGYDWCYVSWGGYTGYVSTQYLSY